MKVSMSRLLERRTMLLGRAFRLESSGLLVHASRVWDAADRADRVVALRMCADDRRVVDVALCSAGASVLEEAS